MLKTQYAGVWHQNYHCIQTDIEKEEKFTNFKSYYLSSLGSKSFDFLHKILIEIKKSKYCDTDCKELCYNKFMEWFNYIGLIFVALLLIPNIIFAFKNKGEQNKQNNKVLGIFEQIGRYGSMIFMIFNIPYIVFGYYFACGQILYIAINSALMLVYYILWIIFWKKDCLAKSLLLSILPSILFIISGVLIVNIPLIAFAIIFAVFHILISVKNYIREGN